MSASRRVLVTGASSGIGRAVCLEYARRGASVVAVARTEAKLKEVAREVEAAGGKAAAVAGDVGKRADVRRAIETAEREFGGLDVAIANAGFGIYAEVANVTEEDFDSIFRTNVKGVLWTLQEALPLLRKSRGRVGIVSSILGRAAVPYSALYCMTKHALTALADAARLEFAEEKVSVTLVGPGLTATEFQRNAQSRVQGAAAPSNVAGWSADRVAKKLVQAVEARRRQVYMTLGGRSLIWMKDRFPAVADWGVRRWMKNLEKKRSK